MIAGLHWTAWLLLALAVFPGLALTLAFHRAHRGGDGSTDQVANSDEQPGAPPHDRSPGA